MVVVESELVTKRVTREAASQAAFIQMAVSSLFSKKAHNQFSKMLKEAFADD